jgi:trehalose-phosphatase
MDSALECYPRIEALLHGRRPAVFLDYDGTLTPIVARPELAVLDATMRETLRGLAALCPVAVISGRDLGNVRDLVAVPELSYSGSHGYAIRTADGRRHEHPAGVSALPGLDAAEAALREALGPIEGHLVERKRFSVAVHYRNVRADDEERVRSAFEQVAGSHPGLRRGEGKKVMELLPDADWDKGRAVTWLLDALALDGPTALPVFVGDDVTDEHAFRAIADAGIGVLVSDTPRATAARFWLRDVDEVRGFLERLADSLRRDRASRSP